MWRRLTEDHGLSLDSVAAAANAVKNGEMSLHEAEAKFGVPKSTLERHKNNKIVTPGDQDLLDALHQF